MYRTVGVPSLLCTLFGEVALRLTTLTDGTATSSSCSLSDAGNENPISFELPEDLRTQTPVEAIKVASASDKQTVSSPSCPIKAGHPSALGLEQLAVTRGSVEAGGT